MIKQDEIKKKSEEYGIHTSDVQRDYIFGWVLNGVYVASALKDILILKGGNVYRKAYFPSARFSGDLDFTTDRGLDEAFLLEEFNKICSYVEKMTGVQFRVDRNRIADELIIQNHKKVYKLRLYFKDFFGVESQMIISIRLDVTEFDKIHLPTQRRVLIHPYSDQSKCQQEITCIKIEEALADKLKCLIQRRSSFDVFDLVNSVFINNEIDVDKKEIVTTFLKKTIFESSPIVAKNLLLGVPYDICKTYWESCLVCPQDLRMDFDRAITVLKAGIEELFKEFSYSFVSIDSFYPPELRNKILNAGESLTQLKLNYHGYSRFVEPYALSFKRRKDGVAQEYFYAFDRTGGHHGPGIKAFLNREVASLENTDLKFMPKFEVEVAKAGEMNSRSYFGGGFNVARKTPLGIPRIGRIRRVRSSSPAIYTIQCSFCGKKFKRASYSTRINKHKNPYGGECYGRTGFVV